MYVAKSIGNINVSSLSPQHKGIQTKRSNEMVSQK